MNNLQNLILNDNFLTGAVPNELNNLSNIRYLYIHNNAFTDLPDLSSLSPMCEIKVENNKFTFEDIEPNIFIEVDSFNCGTYDTVFTYAPQDSVLDAYDTIIDECDNISISALVGGANNVYQWYKNGSPVSGSVLNPYFTISSANISDEGIYTCAITNTLVTGLTLHRRPINLIVNPVGTNNREATKEIIIYPNPNNGTFYLTNIEINNKIEICTIQGCILYSKQIVQNSDKIIYFNGYLKGIYFIKISTNNFTNIEKIIVY
ncbi:MAG: T9SS type A sorting domain-containing protein [Bacteroidia bacterium]|nr:T9SS type A sorting domain-containing protein [Bacteroidia bacterium]